ncbi:hypothetical protein [Pseudomonas sp. Irchel s3a18]|uniref:hypothetical protein n=1 Tax=Pseudomonas sp. Irchel s3a18 TaxID=2009053 RepID=UPI000BA325F6|nr:hypothetical protein [Pseudomonas sp. Irchel s3a18]
MKQAVLKTITAEDIQAVREEAERLYMSRVEGNDFDFQGEPNEMGELPRRWFLGALVEFVAHPTPDDLLSLVFEKVAEGWTRSTASTTSSNGGGVSVFRVYLKKPIAQQQLDLEILYAEAEAKLRAKVDQENELIVEREVQLQVANAARLKAEQLAKEEQDAAEVIRKEVEQALGRTRQTVRAALKGAK